MTVIAAFFLGAVAGFLFASICTAAGVADDDEIREQCFRDGYRQGAEDALSTAALHRRLFDETPDPSRN